MADRDGSLRELVIALCEGGGLSGSAAGGPYAVTVHDKSVATDMLDGRESRKAPWNRVSSPAQDTALVAAGQTNPPS